MTVAEELKARATEIAEEAHCRYCDNLDEPRLKCKRDVEYAARAIVEFAHEALERAAQEADSVDRYHAILNPIYTENIVTRKAAKQIAARIRALKSPAPLSDQPDQQQE